MDHRDISPFHTLSGCSKVSGALTGKENRKVTQDRNRENQLDRRRETRHTHTRTHTQTEKLIEGNQAKWKDFIMCEDQS